MLLNVKCVVCVKICRHDLCIVGLRCLLCLYAVSIFYFLLQLFAIIVFGCISSQGYKYDRDEDKEVCLYNKDNNACNYGVGIGVIAFLASIAFLVGEFMFEQMSSVKTRKHYVLGDLGFSGSWTDQRHN